METAGKGLNLYSTAPMKLLWTAPGTKIVEGGPLTAELRPNGSLAVLQGAKVVWATGDGPGLARGPFTFSITVRKQIYGALMRADALQHASSSMCFASSFACLKSIFHCIYNGVLYIRPGQWNACAGGQVWSQDLAHRATQAIRLMKYSLPAMSRARVIMRGR